MKFNLPTANREDFKEGFNFMPEFAYKNMLGGDQLIVNLDFIYNYTSPYKTGGDTLDPQDEFFTGVGMEYVKSSNVSVLFELTYNKLITEAKQNGSIITGTAGEQSEAIAGLKFKYGSLKAKIGVVTPLGSTSFSDYKYKFVFGMTYILGIFAM